MADKESILNKKEEKKDSNCIFSKENVNMGRQSELDYYKGLNVILMTLLHGYENFSQGFLFSFLEFLSIFFGAAAFMILMGIGMRYSRHHELKNYINRGFSLLTMGIFVNLIRNALPNVIAWWITGNYKFISRALLILQGDILTFAGIAFLFLALLKKMKLSDSYILIISIIMNTAALFIYQIMKPPKNYLLSQFLGYFVMTDAEAFFPLFSHFLFVAFGYWFGGIYQKILNKNKFYSIILIICLPLSIIYNYLRSHFIFPLLPEYMSNESFILVSGPDALATIINNLTTIAIYQKIDMIFKGKTPKFILHASQNLNQYYILGYIFIIHINTFMQVTGGEESPSKMKYPTLVNFMILLICKILIDMNDKYIHFTITTLKNRKRKIVFSLIWIMSIISTIYIYPKVEIYATIWNYYLDLKLMRQFNITI